MADKNKNKKSMGPAEKAAIIVALISLAGVLATVAGNYNQERYKADQQLRATQIAEVQAKTAVYAATSTASALAENAPRTGFPPASTESAPHTGAPPASALETSGQASDAILRNQFPNPQVQSSTGTLKYQEPILKDLYYNDNFDLYQVQSSDGLLIPVVGGSSSGDVDAKPAYVEINVTNPNDLTLSVDNLLIEVMRFHGLESFQVAGGIPTTGDPSQNYQEGAKAKEYKCVIKNTLGLYACTLSEYDFIKIPKGDIDRLRAYIVTDTPGLYNIRVQVSYTIGDETNTLLINDTYSLGFIDRK